MPSAFCASDAYFRQCYSVTAQKCEEISASTTRICINKHSKNIPKILNQPKDGEKWGGIIGNCAAKAYGQVLSNEFIKTEKCSSAESWAK
jgi:hypothetical protein